LTYLVYISFKISSHWLFYQLSKTKKSRRVVESRNPFLKCFRDKCSTFDHLYKDMQVVRVILARERRQTNFKTSRNVGKLEKTMLEYGFQRVRDVFSYSFLFRLYLIWHEIDKHNDETRFVNKTTSYSAIHMVKCKTSHYFIKLWFTTAKYLVTSYEALIFSHITSNTTFLKCELSCVIMFKRLTPEVSFYKQTDDWSCAIQIIFHKRGK
jgi:hypothetical protein